MKLTVTSEMALAPTDDSRFVSWFGISVTEATFEVGRARVALVHVGEIADSHGDVWRALRASKLEHLAECYFEHGWYRDDVADGAGIDLTYVAELEVAPHAAVRRVDFAIVRRLAETLASSSQLLVLPYANAEQAARWGTLGFEIGTFGRTAGLIHLKLGARHARVVDRTGNGDFEVESHEEDPLPSARPRHGFRS